MAISIELIRKAIEAIAAIDGVLMDPASLAEDAAFLAYAFPEESEFQAACANTCRALRQICNGSVTASNLKYEFEDWQSYHYQHRVRQGLQADCRIKFRQTPQGIEVKGFGHRRIPRDFYLRMAGIGRSGSEN